MKHLILLGVVLLGTFVLVGCPSKDKGDSGSSGNYTITNTWSYSAAVYYKSGSNTNYAYLTTISAGQSWKGNIPSDTYELKAVNLDSGATRWAYYPPIPGSWVIE
ncbi:MAG: hypothetical protein AB1599_02215 [Planctomycetota bacterium]